MARSIESIFEECLQRMQNGESIESCLQSYPEYALQLQDMLSTAINVAWRSSFVMPDPNYKARARMQLQGAMYAIQQERQSKNTGKTRSFKFQHVWVPAAICICILLFGSVGTAAAATESMPDHPLYPVKLVTEQVQMALAFSENDKAMLNVKMAENRSKEIAAMASAGKTDLVISTSNRLVTNLEKADTAIQKVAETNRGVLLPNSVISTTQNTTINQNQNQTGKPSLTNAEKVRLLELQKLQNTVDSSLKKNITVLENVLDKAPDSAKPAIQNAITAARNKQEVINKNLPVKINEFNRQELPKINEFNNQDLPKTGIPVRPTGLPSTLPFKPTGLPSALPVKPYIPPTTIINPPNTTNTANQTGKTTNTITNTTK
jgi:hypothetical protein